MMISEYRLNRTIFHDSLSIDFIKKSISPLRSKPENNIQIDLTGSKGDFQRLFLTKDEAEKLIIKLKDVIE